MWQQRQINNLPAITPKLLTVLEQLVQASAAHRPLEIVLHHHTRRALIKRDWVTIVSQGFKEEAYLATTRGEKAYQTYTGTPTRKTEKICPTCGIRPRAVTASGRVYAYCRECYRAYQHAQYRLKHGAKTNRPCPLCGIRPRAVAASGHVYPYCRECLRQKNAIDRQNFQQRQLAAATKIPLCCRCHQLPRHHGGKTTYSYCRDCLRKYHSRHSRLQRRKVKR